MMKLIDSVFCFSLIGMPLDGSQLFFKKKDPPMNEKETKQKLKEVIRRSFFFFFYRRFACRFHPTWQVPRESFPVSMLVLLASYFQFLMGNSESEIARRTTVVTT